MAIWARRALLIGLPIAATVWLYLDVQGRLRAPEKDVNFTDGDLVRIGGPRPNPSVLYFWETSCDRCLSIQDTLDEQSTKWEIIGVAVHPGEPSGIDGYHSRNRLHYRSVHDQYRELVDLYHLNELPAVVFIDKQGRVAAKGQGRMTMLHLHFYYWLSLL